MKSALLFEIDILAPVSMMSMMVVGRNVSGNIYGVDAARQMA
jgi:hypothetical protein